MPAPEDLSDSGPEPQSYGGYERGGERGERGERGGSYEQRPEPPPRPGFEDAVWFRLDFGRNKNAEARWLLPMICRRGHVTKTEIGAIRIFDRETRFQIIGSMAESFAGVAAKGGGDGGNIERLDDDAAPPPRDRSISSSRHRAMSEETERAPRPKPTYAERKAKRDDHAAGPRNDDFLRDEFTAAPARSEGFKKPDYKKARPAPPKEGFKEGFKKPDFKKPDFKKPDFRKPAPAGEEAAFVRKPHAGPKADKPWTPRLDDGDGPAKPPKVKKSKKRKANG
jgi:ATP-dependent RNA helicase DeaD